MNLPAPGLVSPPATADRVASRLLDHVGDARTATVPYRIGWSGPVDLPLADEAAVQAACGIMAVHGRAGGCPVPLCVEYASTVAGILAAQGVCAVLLARTRSGAAEPVRVETSVAQAALSALTQYLAADTAEGEEAPSRSSAEPGGGTLLSGDGVHFELEALDAERWLRFWQRLGAPHAEIGRGWHPFQQRFGTAVCPLPRALRRTARSASYAAVRAAARQAGADVLPVREATSPPVATPPWSLTPLPGSPRSRGGDPIDGPSQRPLQQPLTGLRLVESTRRVQGPMAGHILGMLGARVIRVEPPGGDPMRGVPPMAGGCSARFRALNDGKAVVEADITTAAGRRTVHELVADADVFLNNWAPGKAARLRLDAENLAPARPGLVYAWASGWGDALGPTPPVGTDFLVQAHSGLAAALRPAPEAPAPSLMTLTDVLGGLMSAQAVLAALLARARDGLARRADSSLFSAAGVVPRRGQRVRAFQALEAGPAPATTEVCTDLAALAQDPRFAGALTGGEYARPRPPWTFS